MSLARYLVSWAQVSSTVLLAVFAVVLLMAAAAAAIAARPALNLEPARVFRA
jgi:ABC-type antimicrobial peptide transport system permease subunit